MDGSNKEIRFILYAIVLLGILQMAMLFYLRKKFDDDISFWWNRQYILHSDFVHMEKVFMDKQLPSPPLAKSPKAAGTE